MAESGSTPITGPSHSTSQLKIKQKPKNRATLVSFILILATTLGVVIQMIRPYFLSLILGLLLALLTYKPYEKLRMSGMQSKYASLLITLGAMLLIVGPLTVFSILAVRQGMAIAERIGANEQNHFSLPTFLAQIQEWRPVKALIGDAPAFQEQTRNWIRETMQSLTRAALGVAANIPQFLLQAILAIISCFYFLLDGKRFLSWLADKIPLEYEVRKNLAHSIQNTAISVIWATLAAAGAQSSVILTAFLILAVPAAFLAAGTTFVFAWIPMLGSFPVWITGAIYLYNKDSILKAVLMLGFGAFTSVIDNIVRPWVLKGRGQMHPLVSLMAIFGGIRMFGLLGVFIGPILASLAISMLQVWPIVGRRFGLIPDVDPKWRQ